MSSDSTAELAKLIELFVACIEEDIGTAARADRAKLFNTCYEAYVARDPEENLSRFARRVSLRGIPYIRAFIQIVQIRGLGTPPPVVPEPRRKRPPTKRPTT
ncbi:MAG TPA: hypothetical protein VFQ53_14090 [Kofleriaceae bacterium]|nr:hypothetical protein [Kofleriaceae bacterium]